MTFPGIPFWLFWWGHLLLLNISGSTSHVEQEPGVHHQAAGDLGVVAVDGLEAGHDDLEEKEPDPALPTDGDHVLVVDEHGHLCRRAELGMTHNYMV